MPAQILEPSIFNQESWGGVRFADFERTKTLVVLGPVRVNFGSKTLGPGSGFGQIWRPDSIFCVGRQAMATAW